VTSTERLTAALADRYRIERELGAGGMATVYLAQDLKHDRKVAIKVLRPELAAVLGAERFVQEIRTTAALNHPHILPLYDSGRAGADTGGHGRTDEFLFYVMPYIRGETIRERLNRETQFGIEEAVKIATEVADALEYAHEQGVIHRDIKPENILLHNGRPMVMDFGIALAVSAAAGGRMTETGLSLGTPHYMSPEQATADKQITARSDVYSLACVLYEMLTGSPPHLGGSAQQIIMKIVTETPAPVTQMRKSVPPNVAAAVAKALEKLPADRFPNAAAFASALADPSYGAATAGAPAHRAAQPWRAWLRDPRSWVALAAVGILAGVALSPGRTPAGPSGTGVIRFTITGPVDSTFVRTESGNEGGWPGPVVSPDGRHIAFGVNTSSGRVLYLRAMDSLDLQAIPGEGPFFSPTGSRMAFFRASEVWTLGLEDRVPSRAGVIPEVEWDLSSPVWHPDGRLLVSAARGIWALPARGGEPSLLVPTDSARGQRFGRIGVLGDGRLLLTVLDPAGSHLEVIAPDGEKRVPIAPGAEEGQIVEDILVFRQAGQDRATRFDLRRLEPVGEPIALPRIAASRLGRSIAWVDSAAVVVLEPVWVTRDGRVTPVGLPGGAYRWPRVSPDGGRIVANRSSRGDAIAVSDLARHTTTRLDGSTEPVWSPDGSRVYMSTGNRPLGGLVEQVADGSRPPDTLLALDRGDSWPTSTSPDGQWLAYYGATLGSGDAGDVGDPNDLFFLDLPNRESRRVRLSGSQRGARFSPDGRWVAYQSTESGREEVHVRPWPAMDANFPVSAGGGTEPIWSRDGGELYYRHGDDVLAVGITVQDGRLQRTSPRVLFSRSLFHDFSGDLSWDLGPDGRFVMLRPVPGGRATVHVALNWIDDVRARLEGGR